MDLRGFTQSTRMAEELSAPFGDASASRAILEIDASTDMTQLESALAAALSASGSGDVRILWAAGAARTVSATIALLDSGMSLSARSGSALGLPGDLHGLHSHSD